MQRNGRRHNHNGVEGGEAITLPMAQVPIIPHNVNLINFIDDSDNAFKVAPMKRTRASLKEKEVEGESTTIKMSTSRQSESSAIRNGPVEQTSRPRRSRRAEPKGLWQTGPNRTRSASKAE